jgi:hypothetical protein
MRRITNSSIVPGYTGQARVCGCPPVPRGAGQVGIGQPVALTAVLRLLLDC